MIFKRKNKRMNEKYENGRLRVSEEADGGGAKLERRREERKGRKGSERTASEQ